MNTQQVVHFLEALGCSGIRTNGLQVSTSCPLAPWLHPGGKDSNPSFGVKAGDPSLFNCFSCQSKGTLRTLVREYERHSGKMRLDLMRMLLSEGSYQPSKDTTSPVESPEDRLWSARHDWHAAAVAQLRAYGVPADYITHVKVGGAELEIAAFLSLPERTWTEWEALRAGFAVDGFDLEVRE